MSGPQQYLQAVQAVVGGAGRWWEAPPPGSILGPALWAPHDYVVRDLFTPKAATGAAGETITATLGPVPDGHLWAVTRSTVSVRYTTAENVNQAGPVVRHYLDVASGPVVSGTNSGDYDEADYPYPSGLLVPSGRSLLAVWGAAAGFTIGVQVTGIGQWHVEYVDLTRGGQ